MYSIPMKWDHAREFSKQINWKDFHQWFNKQRVNGNDNVLDNRGVLKW